MIMSASLAEFFPSSPTPPHDFATVASDVIHDSPILTVRGDEVLMPGGTTARRDIIEHLGAVAVVALRTGDQGEELMLVRQWRQAVRQRLVELPAGILDRLDEDPLAAAQRELAEEAGLRAERWSVLVDLVSAPGFCEETVRVYLAEGLEEVATQLPEAGDEEAELQSAFVPLGSAVAAIYRGEIINSIAVGGILATALRDTSSTLRSTDAPWSTRPTHMPERRRAAWDLRPGDELKFPPRSVDTDRP